MGLTEDMVRGCVRLKVARREDLKGGWVGQSFHLQYVHSMCLGSPSARCEPKWTAFATFALGLWAKPLTLCVALDLFL